MGYRIRTTGCNTPKENHLKQLMRRNVLLKTFNFSNLEFLDFFKDVGYNFYVPIGSTNYKEKGSFFVK